MRNWMKLICICFILCFTSTGFAFSFGKQIEAQSTEYEVDNQKKNKCYVTWSIEIENQTNKTLKVQPSVKIFQDLKRKTRTTRVDRYPITLEPNASEEVIGFETIDNCRKKRVTSLKWDGQVL